MIYIRVNFIKRFTICANGFINRNVFTAFYNAMTFRFCFNFNNFSFIFCNTFCISFNAFCVCLDVCCIFSNSLAVVRNILFIHSDSISIGSNSNFIGLNIFCVSFNCFLVRINSRLEVCARNRINIFTVSISFHFNGSVLSCNHFWKFSFNLLNIVGVFSNIVFICINIITISLNCCCVFSNVGFISVNFRLIILTCSC